MEAASQCDSSGSVSKWQADYHATSVQHTMMQSLRVDGYSTKWIKDYTKQLVCFFPDESPNKLIHPQSLYLYWCSLPLFL